MCTVPATGAAPSVIAGTGRGEPCTVHYRPPHRCALRRLTGATSVGHAGRIESESPRQPWLALVPLLTGTFLGTVTNSIVNVPLRNIAAEFGVSVSHTVLVSVAFMLTFAVTMPVLGWLGDRVGRRRVFSGALAVLAAATAVAAFAPNLASLVALRAVQGLATAAILPAVMGMIADLFTPDQRGRALGWWAGANGLGQAVGPTLGGLVAHVASWRWIFVPVAPLAVLALMGTLRWVPDAEGRGVSLEWRGALTLTAGTALVIGAAAAVSQPVSAVLPASLTVAGVVALAAFAALSRTRPHPFVAPRLVREPSYLRSSLAVFTQMFCLGATTLGVALHLTRNGASTAFAGLVVLTLPAAMALLAPASGVLTDRLGPRWVMRSGLVVLVASQAWLAAVLAWQRATLDIIVGLVFTGVATALVQTPAALGATRSAAGRAGAGLGLFNLIRFSGLAIGAAWVAVALGVAGGLATMFAAGAAVAAGGFLATFAGPDRPPSPALSQ